MSIEGYNVKEQALGDGSLTEFTFDFKISQAADLLVIISDSDGVEQSRVTGDDESEVISELEFDSVDGGGTVTLLEALEEDYTITMLLAPDEPDQSFEFRDKGSFTNRMIEQALDKVMAFVSRCFYLAQRSIKLHDLDESEEEGAFDPVLPQGIKDNPGAGLFINDDGDGFEYGPTAEEVAAAEGYAEAASDSADAAAASAVLAAAQALGFYVTPQLAQPSGANALNVDGLSALALNSTTRSEMQFVQGDPGAVNLLSGSEIEDGQFVGKLLILIGGHATNTVTLVNSLTLKLNGDCTLGLDDAIGLVWNGTYWAEIFRRG